MTTGKVAARNARFWINQANVSGDLNDVSLNQEAETPDASTFGATYRVMIKNSLRTWTATWGGFFNDIGGTGSPGIENLLRPLVNGSVVAGMYWSGTATSQLGYDGAGVLTSLAIAAPLADMVTANAGMTGSDWLARTWVLAGSVESGSTATGSISGCSVDMGASWGGTFYGVFRMPEGSATGTGSVQATVQHSGDDASFSDLLTFTTVNIVTTSSTFEVKSATAASRYIRSRYAIGVSGSSASAALMVTGGKAL